MFSTPSRQSSPLKAEQIEPVDAPITKALAKKIYRDYMLHVGHLDKDEVSEHVEYLADDMREHEEDLKLERDDCRDNLAEEKRELAQAKQALKAFVGTDEQERWQDEVQSLQGSVRQMTEELEACKGQLAAFKVDKRSYLVEYINRELFGEEWSELKRRALKADAERTGRCYRMHYGDADGVVTKRETGPLVPDGTGKLTGYCFLRNDSRTFKVSRIERLEDLRHGTAVDPRALFTASPKAEPVLAAVKATPARPSQEPPALSDKGRGVSILLGIGIILMPYIFAWALLGPGYSAKARFISFAWLVVVVATFLRG